MTQKNDAAQIVPLMHRHIAQIARIEQACFPDPWSESLLREEMRTPFARYFIYEQAGQVRGYLGTRIILDTCDVLNIAVHPAFRRRGIATELFQALFAFAKDKKISIITLEVRESNLPARTFYEKMGFVANGRRAQYYQAPEEDAILMAKTMK